MRPTQRPRWRTSSPPLPRRLAEAADVPSEVGREWGSPSRSQTPTHRRHEAEAELPQPFETAEPLEWDAERYTTAIEEPDWFEAEADDEPAADVEMPDESKDEPMAAEEPTPDEPTPEEPSADEPAESFPGSTDLQSALEALGVAPEPDKPEPRAEAEQVPAPAPRPEPVGRGRSAGSRVDGALPARRPGGPDRARLSASPAHLPELSPRSVARFDPGVALVVVDLQNDFADPAGSLSVRGGDAIIPVVNSAVDAALAAGALVAVTQDWHPPSTPHFVTDGGVWPVHCVGDTWGAELHPEFAAPSGAVRVRKGTGGEDGYSGFTTRDPVTDEEASTELDAVLRDAGIERVVVCGLATDYCVKATALDAVRLGYEVELMTDAVAAVNLEPGDGDRAIEEMRDAGVRIG